MSKKNRYRKQLDAKLAKDTSKPVDSVLRVGVEPLKDEVFEFQRNRAAPAQDVWGVNGTVSYAPMRGESVEGKGNYVYYYGVPFPSKTIAPVEAIHAMAAPKRLTINSFRFIASLRPLDFLTKKGRSKILTNLLDQYNDIAKMTLYPFYMKDGYYCPCAKEIKNGVYAFLTSLGVEESVAYRTSKIAACFFEFDNAYRCRVQDLAGEVSKEALYNNLPKELQRLFSIQSQRETIPIGGQEVVRRFEAAATVLKYLLYVPSIKRAVKAALDAINIENMKMDEADIYHFLLYGDYNVQGMSFEERLKVLERYHGTDQTKWPMRIIIK